MLNHHHWLERWQSWIFAEQSEAPRLVAGLRNTLQVMVIMFREAIQANLSIRASALTYSVILSMVPLLAMSTAILKGMGGENQLRVAAERFIEQIEPRPAAQTDPIQSLAPSGGTEMATAGFSGHIYHAMDTVFSYVENTNFAAIGAFGVAGLLIVVVMVFSTIEEAMNAIWKSSQGRPLLRKIMDYLALLILLPISINLAFAGEAILASNRMMGYLSTALPVSWLLTGLLKALPFLFIVMTLTLMYLFFSRAQLSTRAALAGAVFASFFWLLTQKMYIFLQVGVAKYNAIYGSFATVPLFLTWLHLCWTFILLGATLAYAIETRRSYRFNDSPLTPGRSLQLCYDLLNATYDDFQERKPTTSEGLQQQLKACTPTEISQTLSTLVAAQLLRTTVINRELTYLPVTTSEQLPAQEVVEVIFGRQGKESPGGELANLALEGARQAVKGHRFQAAETYGGS
ncbi:YihY/virulence factor BrkB family protein [Desulfogranum mediterraneum]|uniref:YihY/virulence factor BrkB family protein n=1 Tax=Desulfogranum mediterraneum TaxID=160661 RepID=UPI0003F4CB04|nr:YihY/virulence factor BrkB family protein [Desulfogranum mediterraneum]